MSDIIYYKNGEETFRISPPTPPTLGTKCPETKLEIKMTETFTLELTLDELHMLDKYVEYCEETKEFFDKLKNAYPQTRMTLENAGEFEVVSYNGQNYYRLEYDEENYSWFRAEYTIDGMMLCYVGDYADGAELLQVLETLWINDVKRGQYDD